MVQLGLMFHLQSFMALYNISSFFREKKTAYDISVML